MSLSNFHSIQLFPFGFSIFSDRLSPCLKHTQKLYMVLSHSHNHILLCIFNWSEVSTSSRKFFPELVPCWCCLKVYFCSLFDHIIVYTWICSAMTIVLYHYCTLFKDECRQFYWQMLNSFCSDICNRFQANNTSSTELQRPPV